jgi:hypothetical protein
VVFAGVWGDTAVSLRTALSLSVQNKWEVDVTDNTKITRVQNLRSQNLNFWSAAPIPRIIWMVRFVGLRLWFCYISFWKYFTDSELYVIVMYTSSLFVVYRFFSVLHNWSLEHFA